MSEPVGVVAAAPNDSAASALDSVTLALEHNGYAMVEEFLPADVISALRHACLGLAELGRLETAGIGRGDRRVEDAGYRRTEIRWIEEPFSGAEARLMGRMQQLRQRLNEQLQLGLVDCECHYALYPPGGFYRRHVDRFLDDDRRTVSCVLYLNEHWQNRDGGELRLYPGGDGSALDVAPTAGRFVAFLSEHFPHEVLPTSRERLCVAAWMRRRALGGLPGI